MALHWKVAKYTALAIGVFVLVSAIVSIVGTLLGIAASILAAIVSLVAVAAVAYGLVKGILWLRGTSADASQSSDVDAGADDRVDGLTKRYVDGKLSETELERQLERELDGPEIDDIDRELERSQSK